MHRRRLLLALAAVLVLTGCRESGVPLFDAGRSVLRVRAGVDHGFVDAGTHRLGYLERDAAGPTLVLLHGFASEKDVWLRFMRHLPDDYRVVAIDLPGHGDANRDPDLSYDVPSMVAAIDGAIAELAPRPYHLAGTSLGGMVATLQAARDGADVVTLALFAPAGVYPPNPSDFQRLIDQGENPLIAHDPEQFDRLLDVVFHDPPTMPWPVRPILRRYAMKRASFNEKIWNDVWNGHTTLDPVLPDLDIPVFLLWGREDRVLDVSSVEVYETLLPQVESVILDATGHASINERPREIAGLYVEFLRRAAPPDETSVASPSSAGVGYTTTEVGIASR